MKLVFTCPETEKIFYSDKCHKVENRGATHDLQGPYILDALLKLGETWRVGGRRQVYTIAGLDCPFSPSGESSG